MGRLKFDQDVECGWPERVKRAGIGALLVCVSQDAGYTANRPDECEEFWDCHPLKRFPILPLSQARKTSS